MPSGPLKKRFAGVLLMALAWALSAPVAWPMVACNPWDSPDGVERDGGLCGF